MKIKICLPLTGRQVVIPVEEVLVQGIVIKKIIIQTLLQEIATIISKVITRTIRTTIDRDRGGGEVT